MILKKIFYLAFFITCIISGCQKDLGNYAFQEINEIQISGIDSLYIINYGERLTIKPKLSYTMDTNPDTANYTYEWFKGIESGIEGIAPKLITKSMNLDGVLNINLGEILMYYRVTDKKTGMYSLKQFKLAVTNEGYEGWLVLNDDNSNSRLDMVNIFKGTKRIYKDIFKQMKSNFVYQGRPISIITTRTNDTQSGFHNYLVTDKGGFGVDYDTYNSDAISDFKNIVPNNTSTTDYTGTKMSVHGAMIESVYSNGNIYLKPYSFDFRSHINRENDITFKPSRFVAVPNTYISPACILFNEDKSKFYRYPGSGTNCFPLDIPEINTSNKELLFLTYSKYNAGEVFAVLKDKSTQKVYLGRMLTSGQFLSYDEITGGEIANAEHFAVNSEYGYLFYSVGGNLYEFDFSLKTTKRMLNLSNEKISMIKFQLITMAVLSQNYTLMQNDLLVGTYNPVTPKESGKLSIYKVPGVGGNLETKDTFNGFDKIVDVSYKERF